MRTLEFLTYMARIEMYAKKKAMKADKYGYLLSGEATWYFSYRDDMLLVGKTTVMLSDVIGVSDITAKDLKVKIREVVSYLIPWMGISAKSINKMEFTGAYISISTDTKSYVRKISDVLDVIPGLRDEVEEDNIFPKSFGGIDLYLSTYYGKPAVDLRALRRELSESGFECVYSKKLNLHTLVKSNIKSETIYIYRHDKCGAYVSYSVVETQTRGIEIRNGYISFALKGKSLLVQGVLSDWNGGETYYWKDLHHGFSKDLHNVYGVSEYEMVDVLRQNDACSQFWISTVSVDLSYLGGKIREGSGGHGYVVMCRDAFSSVKLSMVVTYMEMKARAVDSGYAQYCDMSFIDKRYKKYAKEFLDEYPDKKSLLHKCEFIVKKEYGLRTW